MQLKTAIRQIFGENVWAAKEFEDFKARSECVLKLQYALQLVYGRYWNSPVDTRIYFWKNYMQQISDNILLDVRFKVLTEVTTKITALWYVTLCSLTDHYHSFKGTWYFHLQSRKEAADFSKMMTMISQITWHQHSIGQYLHCHRSLNKLET